MAEKDTALAVVKPTETKLVTRAPSPYIPQNVTEAMALAKLIAQSDLATKEYRGKPANVMIAMQMGAEVGLSPMAAIQNIAVINGRPSLWGDAALGVVQVHPAYEWHKEWIEGEGDNMVAIFQIKRKGQEVHTSKFSVADAKTAKLWGKKSYEGKDTPWVTSPKRMLAMRARGFGLRDKFADALRGLILAEEAMDMPVDTSTKKERGVLDADALGKLTASAEPNRGHDNEGMQKTETPPTKQMSRGVVTVTKIEPGMKKPTPAQIAKAKREKQPEPEGRSYFILHCVDTEQNEWPVYSFDTKHHEHIIRSLSKQCEFSVTRTPKDDKIFYGLEHIHRIGDIVFENDLPVVQAESGELKEPENLFDQGK